MINYNIGIQLTKNSEKYSTLEKNNAESIIDISFFDLH